MCKYYSFHPCYKTLPTCLWHHTLFLIFSFCFTPTYTHRICCHTLPLLQSGYTKAAHQPTIQPVCVIASCPQMIFECWLKVLETIQVVFVWQRHLLWFTSCCHIAVCLACYCMWTESYPACTWLHYMLTRSSGGKIKEKHATNISCRSCRDRSLVCMKMKLKV